MIEVEFTKKAEKVYQKLKKSKLKDDLILVKAIDLKVDLIKGDPHYGVKVKHKQIPKELNLKNLFRIELPCYWRMLYTLEKGNLKIMAFVIDISNHKKYENIMKY